MCEQIRIRTRHWSMLRYWLLVFSLESKLENKLVVSLSCRLGIARDTKVSIKKNVRGYKVEEKLNLGVSEQKGRIPLPCILRAEGLKT
jgi:hypothetical protein